MRATSWNSMKPPTVCRMASGVQYTNYSRSSNIDKSLYPAVRSGHSRKLPELCPYVVRHRPALCSLVSFSSSSVYTVCQGMSEVTLIFRA
jgi:hypothetical protein